MHSFMTLAGIQSDVLKHLSVQSISKLCKCLGLRCYGAESECQTYKCRFTLLPTLFFLLESTVDFVQRSFFS